MVVAAEVWLWDRLAGAIFWDETQQLASFEFDQGFLRSGWDIAPVTMPLRQGKRLYTFPEIRRGRNDAFDTFKGLGGCAHRYALHAGVRTLSMRRRAIGREVDK